MTLTPLTRRLLVLALVIVAAWFYSTTRPVFQADGVLVSTGPVEQAIDPSARVFERGAYRMTALASFSGEARLIALQRYSLDRAAAIAPVDVALGWGKLSDSAVLRSMDLAQSERLLVYHAYDSALADQEIQSSTLNLHLVPADAQMERKLTELRTGQVALLEGYVVDVAGPDGWRWRGEAPEPGRSAVGKVLWIERIDIRQP